MHLWLYILYLKQFLNVLQQLVYDEFPNFAFKKKLA